MKRLLVVLLALVFSSASLSADIIGKAQSVSSLKECTAKREGKIAKVLDADSIYAIGDGGGSVVADVTCKSTVWVVTGHSNAVQTATCADDGAGTNATLTLLPSGIGTDIEITNADATGCTVTMSETGMAAPWFVRIKVVATAGGTVDFSDSAGVTELSAAYTMGLYDMLSLSYSTTRWVEAGRSNN